MNSNRHVVSLLKATVGGGLDPNQHPDKQNGGGGPTPYINDLKRGRRDSPPIIIYIYLFKTKSKKGYPLSTCQCNNLIYKLVYNKPQK